MGVRAAEARTLCLHAEAWILWEQVREWVGGFVKTLHGQLQE